MENVVDLITTQDLDAFVDDELTDARLCAVRNRLLKDEAALRRVMKVALVNEALRAMADVVRREPALNSELAELRRKAA